MSWDLFVQDLPSDARSIQEIPEDFQPRDLGLRADWIRRIQAVLPGADFSDPSWGTYEADGVSVEFNMGDEEILDSFALHLRGGGAAPFVVRTLLEGLGVRALDPQSESGFFALDAGSLEGFEAWRRHRDSVLRRPPA